MNDPMGLMISMFGMPLMQQMAGPSTFIPHFTPSQALFDQYQGYQHQKNTFQAVTAANRTGNEQLASRFMGLRSLVTDAPATDLNREQASQFAALANNPFAKALAGSLIGPENLEALMFGRKGDPGALASSTSRMGFFRRDPGTGGQRMSAESMEQFSKDIYANLYGPDADLGDMHGFMASQTGTLMEEVFQRGGLPKALGNMSPADRVKAIGEQSRDGTTMDRLAREFGHTEMLKDEKYAKATDIEQRKMLDANVDKYRERLDKTFTEIDKFKNNDPRAKSAQEIEKMEGFGLAASSVDARRVSDTAKKYLGAVDAVREIFGDGGRGNAPMQELIEALDHLSSGSIGQVGSHKVEGVLRSMRIAARDTGMGLEQMADLSYRVTAQGDMMGLARPLSMETSLQAIQSQKAMRDAGMFSGNQWGRMDMQTATMENATRIQRGKASEAGRSLAALNRMVTENPELYKGTELEAAMKAYNDPDSGGVYEFEGKKYDLAATMGEQGRDGAIGILERSGGNSSAFQTFYRDKGTQEYYRSGLEKAAQKAEMREEVANFAVAGTLVDRAGSDEFKRTQGFFQSDEAFERERNALVEGTKDAFASAIVDETGGMSQKDRATHMEKRSLEILTQHYRNQGMGERAATRKAETTRDAMFGDTEARRRESFSQMASEANQYIEGRTGQELAAEHQLYADEVLQGERQVAKEDAAEAAHNKQVSHGKQSSMAQRASEALERMGNDPSYTGEQAAKDIMGGVDVGQMEPGGGASDAPVGTPATRQATAEDLADSVGAKDEFAPGATNTGQATMQAIGAVVDMAETATQFADGGVAAMGVGGVFSNSVLSRTALNAQRTANAVLDAAPIVSKVGKAAPFLGPVLQGAAGAFEGAQNGRGAVEGFALGALTGDASTGSMFSDALGVEKGSTADKGLGVVGATAGGAMTGAAIGAALGAWGGPLAGFTAAGGALVGGALGLGAEVYKWATEPSEQVAQEATAANAVQRTVNDTQTRTAQGTVAAVGKDGSNMEISGTLSLRGLQEAILTATGDRPMETPDGGAPVFGT